LREKSPNPLYQGGKYSICLIIIIREAEAAVTRKIDTKKKDQEIMEAKSLVFHNMLPCALGLPHLIAEAHSYRFGAGTDCLVLLEKTMVNCNKMVVYIEQVRDICQTGLEHEFFEELIKKYLYIRRKTLNLQRVWKKYIEHPDVPPPKLPLR